MLTGLATSLSKSGICAITGILAGSFTGMTFGLSLEVVPGSQVAATQALGLGAALGIIAWFGVLCLLLAMGHYSLSSVLSPSLVTSFVVGVVTAWLVNLVHHPGLGLLIGWFLGFGIGRLFCATCKWYAVGVRR